MNAFLVAFLLTGAATQASFVTRDGVLVRLDASAVAMAIFPQLDHLVRYVPLGTIVAR